MRDAPEVLHVCAGTLAPSPASPIHAPPNSLLRAMLPAHAHESAVLLPGGVLPRPLRKHLERRSTLIWVEADVQLAAGAPGPQSFHAPSLRWALKGAALAVIWTAGWRVPEALPRMIRGALDAGGRVVLILSRVEHEADWTETARRLGSPTTHLALATSAEGAGHA